MKARTRSWSPAQLKSAVKRSRSIRQVLRKLGLKEAGGNYTQVKNSIKVYKLDTSHFTGRSWNKGLKMPFKPKISLVNILVQNSSYKSYKLKRRLFKEGLKRQACELCGWAKISIDGRNPVELDHVNGDKHDNRLSNLRILCPNCHSLQKTHRGLNSRKN